MSASWMQQVYLTGMFLDFKKDTQEILRVRSNILPNDKTIIYIEK